MVEPQFSKLVIRVRVPLFAPILGRCLSGRKGRTVNPRNYIENKMKRIPIGDCEHAKVYQLRSRNLSCGVYNILLKSFIGIRIKFGYEYLDYELHYDAKGSAVPTDLIESLPAHISPVANLDKICSYCLRPIAVKSFSYNEFQGLSEEDHKALLKEKFIHLPLSTYDSDGDYIKISEDPECIEKQFKEKYKQYCFLSPSNTLLFEYLKTLES